MGSKDTSLNWKKFIKDSMAAIQTTFWGKALCALSYYSGLTHIFRKFKPSEDKKNYPTGIIWAIGIYVAIFGIASQRYQNRIDIIDNRANAIFTQLGTDARKSAIGRIAFTQNMWCPTKPRLSNPLSIIMSLFTRPTDKDERYYRVAKSSWDQISPIDNNTNIRIKRIEKILGIEKIKKIRDNRYTEIEVLLKETIENFKNKLNGAPLKDVDLLGADLRYANLDNADLTAANLICTRLRYANLADACLWGAFIMGADLRDSNLTGAELTDANLTNANLTNANLKNSSLTNTDLTNVNLRDIQNMNSGQLSFVKSLIGVQNLDPEIKKELLDNKPDIFTVASKNPSIPAQHSEDRQM